MPELAQPGPRFREIARGKLGDSYTQAALDQATDRLRTNRVAAWEALPDLEALRRRAHEIRMEVIDDLDAHVARFTEALEARGGHVFFAGTAVEVTPIRSVDKIKVGRGRRGPITEAIQQRFFEIVRGEAPDTHGWLQYVPAPVAAAAAVSKSR